MNLSYGVAAIHSNRSLDALKLKKHLQEFGWVRLVVQDAHPSIMSPVLGVAIRRRFACQRLSTDLQRMQCPRRHASVEHRNTRKLLTVCRYQNFFVRSRN